MADDINEGRAERELLTDLILQDPCRVDRFDASYLDDLPDILREMHGIETLRDDRGEAGALLKQLIGALGLSPDDPIAALAPALRSHGITDEEFGPKRMNEQEMKDRFRYSEVDAWHDAEGVTAAEGQEAVEVIKSFQAQYSRKDESRRLGIVRGRDRRFDDLGRPETGDPWTPLFQRLIAEGAISTDEPALTIGPRWAGEIKYFREQIGLRGAIGLDLFSHDTDLVRTGDMHEMPFGDSEFGLVYQRNTFNKAYDIRKALRDCVRVLRPGGILASDDCLGYRYGVEEAARTNMTSNEWILRFLGDSVAEVIHDVEAPSADDWIERVGQLAVRIRK